MTDPELSAAIVNDVLQGQDTRMRAWMARHPLEVLAVVTVLTGEPTEAQEYVDLIGRQEITGEGPEVAEGYLRRFLACQGIGPADALLEVAMRQGMAERARA